jgi:hypothetical protein
VSTVSRRSSGARPAWRAATSAVGILVALAGVLGAAPRVQATVIGSAWYAENTAPVTSATSEFQTFLTDDPIRVPGVEIDGRASVFVSGPDGAQLVPGTYAGSAVQTPGIPFFVYFFGCTPTTSTFTVAEVSYAGDGTFASLAIDFSQTCTGASGIEHASGALRFHSAVPVRALVATPNNLDFGSVSMAASVSRTITFRNVGTAPTTVGAPSLAGANASSWSINNDSCSGKIVAVSATCTVGVIAHPTTSGDLVADLRLTSNATALPMHATTLRQRGLIPTTVKLALLSGQPTVGNGFSLTATATPAPDHAIMDLYIDGTNYVGRLEWRGTSIAEAWVWALPPGLHRAHGSFYSMSGNAIAADATLDFTVGDTTATTVTLSKTKAYSDQLVTATAKVTGPAGLTGGTLKIRDVTTSVVLGSVAVTSSVRSLSVSKKFAAGAHWIVAEYSGAPRFAPSIVGQTLTVIADTGVALLATTPASQTFYPYRDAYKDTVQVGGTLDERATVSISIYRPTGGRIVLTSLGWKTGVYRYTWNGRNSSGTMYAVGKYKVVQTLRDSTGHVRSVTSYVTISAKRLYTTTTYLNRTTPTKRTTSWIGWQFTLPSATIYKSLVFQVYGRSLRVPGASLGGWDTRRCGWSAPWSPNCVGSWGSLGFTTAWYSRTLSPTYNRSGPYVRGIAATTYGSGVVYKVRLKVVYGILR